MAADPTRIKELEDAVAGLQEGQRTLFATTRKLDAANAETRRRMAALETVVDDLSKQLVSGLSDVHDKLREQTEEINTHVDEKTDALREFVLGHLIELARKWPDSAVVIVSAVLALAVALAAAGLLALTGHLKIG